MAEFCTALCANLVTECVKCISQPIKQQILYVFKCQSYIRNLNGQVKELTLKKEREQSRVDYAKRQGEKIHTDVEQWLTDVKEFIEQVAKPIIGNEGRAEARCFKGLCPNLMARYKAGKKVVKATNAGSTLLGKNFSSVSFRPPPERTTTMYVRGYEAFDSRESILQKIMETLKDVNVNRIGVHGMGGVGKTTLVKKVAWQAIEDKLFDDVVVAEVTQKPVYKQIQEKIASDLGLEFGQHETEFDRARRLHNRLKAGKRVLVILDNIWAKLDFDVIGIPHGDEEKGTPPEKEGRIAINDDPSKRIYKILLTSRNLDVLSNDMNTGKNNFSLEIFSVEEARNLFWKIVGDNSAENSDFQTTAEEILKKCAGLPLAIATIANTLKSKRIHAWKDALNKLRMSNPRSIPEMDENVVSVIELSFNFLQSDEAKKLFLLCSLMDFHYNTTFDYLLRYGIGWGLFQNVHTLESGRDRVHTLVDALKASCLLLEGDTQSSVKMHEFVHAVAISIASTSYLMFNIQDAIELNRVLEEEISKSSMAISLPFRDISELPEKLECPKLELLFLFMNSPSLKISDSFFEEMKQLKVINLTRVDLRSLPSSFSCLLNVQTLCLEECLLGDISTIGELKSLKILSFSRSNIEQLPREIGQLTQLKLLDLSDCSSLKMITANVISKLSLLEELYFDNGFVEWKNEHHDPNGSNANLVELNQLSHLTTLHICIPDAQIITPNLFIQELKRFRILIGDAWNWSHTVEASRILKLKVNNKRYMRYQPIKMLLKRVEELYLDELNDVQNVIDELDKEGFPNLKYLHVQDGLKLLHVVNMEGRTPFNAFPKLEVLSLYNLINVKMICLGPLKETSFNKLKTVKINKCHGLEHLFSTSMAKSLSQLEEINVTDCKNLKVIFAEEDDECCDDQSKIEFTRLRFLKLESLPQFTSFSHTAGDHEDFKTLFGKKVVLPALLELRLSFMAIEIICDNKLLENSNFQNLTILEISYCRDLRYLFPSCMVKSLVRLQQLWIHGCESMEWVILSEEEGMNEMVAFPGLKYLWLIGLPSLKTFCKCTGNLIQSLFDEKVVLPELLELRLSLIEIEMICNNKLLANSSFQNLTILKISFCDDLRCLFPSCMVKSLVRLQHLWIHNCESMEWVILSEEEGMNEIVAFPGLKYLWLSDLPSLKTFCKCTRNLIQSLFDEKVSLLNLETLKVFHVDKLRKIWNDDQLNLDFFNKLKIMDIQSCHNLLNIFPSIIYGRLQTLKVLRVGHCDSVEEIFHFQALSNRETNVITAGQLRELGLYDLPKLKHIWNMCNRGILGFRHLVSIEVDECKNLESIFPASIARQLDQLQELTIRSCMVDEIVQKEEEVEEVVPRFIFPQLTELIFKDLPRLRCFYSGIHISEWPRLKRLRVFKCTEVQTLVLEFSRLRESYEQSPHEIIGQHSLFLVDEISFPSLENLWLYELPKLMHLWHENSQSSEVFQNLTSLEVSWCHSLISLLTSPTARSLMQLTTMEISYCDKMEQIITVVDLENEVKDGIIFKELKCLGLGYLPSLRSFCLGNCNLGFPCLDRVVVTECSKMATFSLGVLSTPKLQIVQLREEEDGGCWEGDLNTTIQQMLNQMHISRRLRRSITF